MIDYPPQALCHHCLSLSLRQDIIIDHWFCWWLGVYFSLLVACRVPFCTQNARKYGWSLFAGTSLTSHCSIYSFFNNESLLSVYGEKPIFLPIFYVVWGFLWDWFLSTTQVDVTQFAAGSFIWWEVMASWDSPLFGNFIYIAFT